MSSRTYGPRPGPARQSRAKAQNDTAAQVKRDGPAAAFQNGRPVQGSVPRGKKRTERGDGMKAKGFNKTCRFLLRLMYDNGARLRHSGRGYWVDVGEGGTGFHREWADTVIGLGAVAEAPSSTPGERQWVLSDLGRQIGRDAQGEEFAGLVMTRTSA